MANIYKGAASTIVGYWRAYGGSKKVTPGVLNASIQGSIDATSTAQQLLFTLPAGAIPLQVYSLGTAGGISTVDVGTLATPDGFANELDGDAATFTSIGSLAGTVLTVDTDVYGRAGVSVGTGVATIVFNYVMEDDGGAT